MRFPGTESFFLRSGCKCVTFVKTKTSQGRFPKMLRIFLKKSISQNTCNRLHLNIFDFKLY